MNKRDEEFDRKLEEYQERVYQAFCDNINTPGIIKVVDEAIV